MQPLSVRHAQETYRQQDVMTASPLELIVLLYDGIRKNIFLARKALKRRDLESAHNKLMRAQDIVTELINCLDLTIPLSAELLRIYEFVLESLVEANLKKDDALLGEILEITENLRGAWVEISRSGLRDGKMEEVVEDVAERYAVDEEEDA